MVAGISRIASPPYCARAAPLATITEQVHFARRICLVCIFVPPRPASLEFNTVEHLSRLQRFVIECHRHENVVRIPICNQEKILFANTCAKRACENPGILPGIEDFQIRSERKRSEESRTFRCTDNAIHHDRQLIREPWNETHEWIKCLEYKPLVIIERYERKRSSDKLARPIRAIILSDVVINTPVNTDDIGGSFRLVEEEEEETLYRRGRMA